MFMVLSVSLLNQNGIVIETHGIANRVGYLSEGYLPAAHIHQVAAADFGFTVCLFARVLYEGAIVLDF